MDMTVIIDFIRPELLILAVVLYILGLFLKMYPKFKAEWTIPYILGGISIILTILYMGFVLGLGWSAAFFVTAFIQSVLVAGLPVFASQLIKQAVKERKIDTQQASTDETIDKG